MDPIGYLFVSPLNLKESLKWVFTCVFWCFNNLIVIIFTWLQVFSRRKLMKGWSMHIKSGQNNPQITVGLKEQTENDFCILKGK